MTIKEETIVIPKTARFYTLGNYTEATKEVVIVLHGYAQLAKYFIQKFESIQSKERIIVAPEGLSKFYWQGMDGRVVASWMTKEDRQNEIIDQKNFLDKIYEHIQRQYPNTKITLFGFSQGVATLLRWIYNTEAIRFDKIVLWAGGIPEDTMNEKLFKKLMNKEMHYVFGDEDPYIREAKVDELNILFEQAGLKIQKTKFKGMHVIDKQFFDEIF